MSESKRLESAIESKPFSHTSRIKPQTTWANTSAGWTTDLLGRITVKPRRPKGIFESIRDLKSLAVVDLRHLYLSFIDLSKIDLRGTNFEGCHLNHGVFDGSDLTNANFRNSDLRHSSFRRANLSGTILEKVVVANSSFDDATGLSEETKEYLKTRGAKGL